MPKRVSLLALLVVTFALVVVAQTKVPCYSGATSPSCTPAERSAKAKTLANAKTAAVIIEAKQGVACGDGSDGCVANDRDAVSVVQRAVEVSELWQKLAKEEPTRADILLHFKTRDRQYLQLCVYDADSNDLLWCEDRNPSISLDNDAFREIVHFLSTRRESQK
jgi:hypothetical protein